jgi:ArsR family transcriptional regulator, arsenate/arsenite/antimonite-responsive transcriptional repressor
MNVWTTKSLLAGRIIFIFANMNERATDIFRALSDPTRLRIVHLLRAGELCVGDLVSVLGVPQPTASRHLAQLRKLGLITSRKNSYWTFYALSPATTPLRQKLYELLDADTAGRKRDERRLASLRRSGGCCPAD